MHRWYTYEADPGCLPRSLDPCLPLRPPLLLFIPMLATLQILWPFFSFKNFQAISCLSFLALFPGGLSQPAILICSSPSHHLGISSNVNCSGFPSAPTPFPAPPSLCHRTLLDLHPATYNHLNAPHGCISLLTP